MKQLQPRPVATQQHTACTQPQGFKLQCKLAPRCNLSSCCCASRCCPLFTNQPSLLLGISRSTGGPRNVIASTTSPVPLLLSYDVRAAAAKQRSSKRNPDLQSYVNPSSRSQRERSRFSSHWQFAALASTPPSDFHHVPCLSHFSHAWLVRRQLRGVRRWRGHPGTAVAIHQASTERAAAASRRGWGHQHRRPRACSWSEPEHALQPRWAHRAALCRVRESRSSGTNAVGVVPACRLCRRSIVRHRECPRRGTFPATTHRGGAHHKDPCRGACTQWWGKTPLHFAAWQGDETMVRLLLRHGGKIDIQDQVRGEQRACNAAVAHCDSQCTVWHIGRVDCAALRQPHAEGPSCGPAAQQWCRCRS